MPSIGHLITYIFLFASINFEVFLLITYFEHKKEMEAESTHAPEKLAHYPSVAVIVPCWNEEKTVARTLESLLALDYPKDKLSIVAVDDGSTDGTWSVLQSYESNPQIKIFHKENGGKYTALNFGLAHSHSELAGCLDADSYADQEALKYLAAEFTDPHVMAAAPSIKLWEPKGVWQLLQKVEYGFGIFTRKLFHYMDAIYITPGPLSIFRREVFETLGPYKHAHNTEDIELALRMQKNGYKIVHAHRAIIYTVAPKKLKPLLKQRVRWSQGFIKNAVDYRDMFFNETYGNLGMFVLPMAAISVISIVVVAIISLVHYANSAWQLIDRIRTVGFDFHPHFFPIDWFTFNTEFVALITIVTFIGSLAMVLASQKMSEGKITIGKDLIYYLALYILIAPLWVAKAMWNAAFSIKGSWR